MLSAFQQDNSVWCVWQESFCCCNGLKTGSQKSLTFNSVIYLKISESFLPSRFQAVVGGWPRSCRAMLQTTYCVGQSYLYRIATLAELLWKSDERAQNVLLTSAVYGVKMQNTQKQLQDETVKIESSAAVTAQSGEIFSIWQRTCVLTVIWACHLFPTYM